MSSAFDQVPMITKQENRALKLSTISRRSFVKTATAVGLGIGLGFLNVLKPGKAEAAYYNDWTSTTSGPCGSYASSHTEQGLKCGPSWYNDSFCAGDGWHANGTYGGGYYLTHRPDQCFDGSYDAWHWTFSNGLTYRCSDGYAQGWGGGGQAALTICPSAV